MIDVFSGCLIMGRFMFSDGYTMHDVAMYWRYGEYSVEGIDKVELPQFTMEDYKTLDKVEELLTGWC